MPNAIELSADEQEQFRKTHWVGAALKGGLLAGAIVWLFPGGNPWTSFARPSMTHLMGRSISEDPAANLFSLATLGALVGHLALSIVLAFLIVGVVYRLRSWKAILAGAFTGLALYGINYVIFRSFAAQLTGEYELNVSMAHFLFGMLAAGTIRGFLRPPQKFLPDEPNPGPRGT